jgi:hypothetical protein
MRLMVRSSRTWGLILRQEGDEVNGKKQQNVWFNSETRER